MMMPKKSAKSRDRYILNYKIQTDVSMLTAYSVAGVNLYQSLKHTLSPN